MAHPIILKTLAAGLLGIAVFGQPLPTQAAGGGGTKTTTDTAVPSYVGAKAEVDAGHYKSAIQALKVLVKTDSKNADAWNLLGFSSRKLKKYDDSAKYYTVALKLDPKHRGALEYQGELFIVTGAMDKAQANLTALKSLCGSCEEYVDLKAALTAAGQS